MGKRVRWMGVLALAAALGACSMRSEESVSEVKPLAPDSLAAWMETGRHVVLLDTRAESLYTAGHLPGAVWAGGRTIPELRDVLPLDHHEPIVFYNQDGEPPVAGEDPAREASERYGFPLVYRLQGGMNAWAGEGRPVDGYRAVGGGG
jgi:rhodanese-related sulfurtransferase